MLIVENALMKQYKLLTKRFRHDVANLYHHVLFLNFIDRSCLKINFLLERFSLDCRKTKTKVNTLANQRA